MSPLLLLLLLPQLLQQLQTCCSAARLVKGTLSFVSQPAPSSSCSSSSSSPLRFAAAPHRSERAAAAAPAAPAAAAAARAAAAAPAPAEGEPLLRVGSRWSPLALQQTKQVIRRVVFASPNRFPAAVAAFLQEEQQQQQQQEKEVEEDQCSESFVSSAAGALDAAAAARLQQRLRYGEIEIVPFQTAADRQLQQQLLQVGGKGLFSKELDEGLLRGEIDFAVHSLKDVSTAVCAGTAIAALLPREDPRDALLFRAANRQQLLPLLDAVAAAAAAAGATQLQETVQVTCSTKSSSSKSAQGEVLVGTASLRRQSLLHFLAACNPAAAAPEAPAAAAEAAAKVRCVLLRGNVQTRLRRLREGVADATLLAAAGLRRLSLLQQQPAAAAAAAAAGLERGKLRPPYADIEVALLPSSVFIPAVGQGIVASQCRCADARVIELLEAISDPAAEVAAAAERAFLAQLDGSCRTPLGAIALLQQQQQHGRQQQQRGRRQQHGKQQQQHGRRQQHGKQQQQRLEFRGFVGEPDGSRMYHAAVAAAVHTPEEAADLGAAAARGILEAAGEGFVTEIISKATQQQQQKKQGFPLEVT
ncbi:hypothetical protein Efla_000681 [Eimeria flavescens]